MRKKYPFSPFKISFSADTRDYFAWKEEFILIILEKVLQNRTNRAKIDVYKYFLIF